MAFMIMLLSMTLTLMQGHSGSVEENIQRWIISTTNPVISIELTTTVGQFVHDLDIENVYDGFTILFFLDAFFPLSFNISWGYIFRVMCVCILHAYMYVFVHACIHVFACMCVFCLCVKNYNEKSERKKHPPTLSINLFLKTSEHPTLSINLFLKTFGTDLLHSHSQNVLPCATYPAVGLEQWAHVQGACGMEVDDEKLIHLAKYMKKGSLWSTV